MTAHKLSTLPISSFTRFSPKPDDSLVRISKVYDGDTFTALCLLSGEAHKLQVRLRGIDCPELRGSGDPEKKAARAVRDVVRLWVLGKVCRIQPHECDKYGVAMSAKAHIARMCW